MALLLVALLAGCGSDEVARSGNGGDGGPGRYQVSGSVSGLEDEPVVLQERSGETRTISQDGEFSFTVEGEDGYQITVVKNPRERLCSVENGQASSIEASVTNVNVTCAPLPEAGACTGSADSDEDTITDCQEVGLGTNPWSDDTDGDGYPDREEQDAFDPVNDNFVFNPRIADLPTMAIDLTSLPQIELDFTESTGTQRTVGTEHGGGQSSSISQDWGGEVSRQVEVGHTISVSATQTVGAKVTASATGLGGEASYEASLSVGFDRSVTQSRGSRVSWSRSESEENTRTYAESLDLSESRDTTYQGGTLFVTAKVRNDGHIPYDLQNLTLSAVLFDPRRPFDIEPVANLQFSDGGFPKTTILTGESAPLNFSAELTLPRAQRVLRESHNLVISPATFLLQDVDEESILLAEKDVSARTAMVLVDYGTGSEIQDQYRVAVNNGDGSRAISAWAALDEVLKLRPEQGTASWKYGNETSARATQPGLTGIGSYVHSDATTQYWMVAHNHNVEGGAGARVTDTYNLLIEGYDLEQIELRAGDRLSLVFVVDNDRDALSNRFEEEIGTDPGDIDSDDDGLEDGEEYYGWLTNLGAPPCDVGTDLRRVYSDPLVPDSDADGVPDDAEKADCFNPSFNFVADAGPDQVVDRSTVVTLFGGLGGNSPSPAVYGWRLVHGPDVMVNGEPTRELTGRNPSFTAPDEVSTLVFRMDATIDAETQGDELVVQVLEKRQNAVFVGPHEGTAPDGTRERPYRTFEEALGFLMPGDDLYVMTQAAPYDLTNTLVLPDGTSLYGGYDASWIRDARARPTPLALRSAVDLQPVVQVNGASEEVWISGLSLRGPDTASGGHGAVGLLVNAESSRAGPVNVVDNVIQAGDVVGSAEIPGSSYGVVVLNLDTVRIRGNRISAGAAGAGAAGAKGADGSGGPGGGPGGGGGGFLKGGDDGTAGTTATGGAPGGGGGGGGGLCTGGGTGGPGDPGAPGVIGAAAPEVARDALVYLPPLASPGTNGTAGGGGGGAGGGGSCGTASGGKGGNGGRGGNPGLGGQPGGSGGASVGLWMNGVTTAEVLENEILAAAGGVGDPGGGGGSRATGVGGDGGSNGSTVGPCPICDRGAAGGTGGRGGDGGSGGRGGSGRGGPSFGVYVGPGIAPVLRNNTITAADAGSGGSNGNSGAGGDSYAVFDIDPADGMIPVLGGNTLTAGAPGAPGTANSGGTAGRAGLAGNTNF